jgi:hypothetical protein
MFCTHVGGRGGYNPRNFAHPQHQHMSNQQYGTLVVVMVVIVMMVVMVM